ncbi:HMR1 protein, partial [Rhinopomastus cyanomelas]|nr:HMR1 protein [Rhinopomastus cyanomelas]
SLYFLRVIVSEPSPGLPQFTEVGYLDGHPIMSYDSATGRMEPRADWMAANLDQHFWDVQTQIVQRYLQLDLRSLSRL